MWHNRFKENREDVNDDARPGRPSTSTSDENIEIVKQKMILDNRQITIREVADDVGISYGSFHVLGMKLRTAMIVPKLINFTQKQRRMDIAQKRLTKFNNSPDLLKTDYN